MGKEFDVVSVGNASIDMTVLIFANGVIDDVEWIRPYLAGATAVIAADGGGKHLKRLDVRPDVVVGDLDSLASAVLESWTEEGTAVVTYDTEKDETDLELALLYAVDHFEGKLMIFGALGGRLDQMMANILLLAHPALDGRRVELVEAAQRAWLVPEWTEIAGKAGDKVSLIPLGGDVAIGRTEGLKWQLKDEILHFGPARGISNVMLGEKAFVKVEAGVLLCMHLFGSVEK